MNWKIPENLRPEFERLAQPSSRDPLQWARDIVARHERGEEVAQATLDMARQALSSRRAQA